MLRNIVTPVNDEPEADVKATRRARPALTVVSASPEAAVQPRRRGEATLDVRTDAVVVELFDQDAHRSGELPERGSARTIERARDAEAATPAPLHLAGRSRIITVVEPENSIVTTPPIVQIFESSTGKRRRLTRLVEVFVVAMVIGVGCLLGAAVFTLGKDQSPQTGRTLIEESIGVAVLAERDAADAPITQSVRTGDEVDLTPSGAPARDEAVVLSAGTDATDSPGGAVQD